MVIEKNKVGVIAYAIHVDNEAGELLEKVEYSQPRTMVFGSGRMLKSFEDKLLGLRSGDSFEFLLSSEESFGDYNSDLLMEIPKTVFMVNGEIKPDTLVVGRVVPMMDGDGNPFDGRVIAVNESTVAMDFNHPLAGKSLFTKGEVLNVREATYDELYPAASGCGCGSHNDSCCGGGSHDHHDEEEGCGACDPHEGHQHQHSHHHGGGCNC
ncbi:MAG: FKBP-type peptidyl-prolyl cis-trans isomerase SlyD [Bacteroidetes bacterium]|nr:MAG: FKBP-type peptidyl-prolyl cis-trans isomerase SlyD [Bacteroidota bacterium]